MRALRYLSGLSLCLVLMATLLPSSPERPVVAQQVASPFGVNGHVATRYGIYRRQHLPLDVMASHNVSWNREEFRWDVIQPAPNRWDWGFNDEMVEKANQRGINILGLLVYSVGWASPGAGVGGDQPAWVMPENLDAYRHYVETVVSRYRGRVQAWEVWNEPNHGSFWRPQPDAGQYATLLRVASEAIRSADPTARVVIGGVAGTDIAFLEQVVAIAGWNAFDVVAVHPYVAPKSPELGHLATGELAKVQAFVERHGGKPIWLTEVGWPTSLPGRWGVGDEGTQANYLVRGMVQAVASPWVERVFWYNWRDDGTDRSNDEHNFGLVGRDWQTPKAGANAFRTMTYRLDGATMPRRLDLAGGLRSTINGFDDPQSWHIWGDGAGATVERSTEQVAIGEASAKVHYRFTNGAKAYVDLQNIREAPGQPRRLALWVYGDSSGHLLWATFRDANNEWFRVYLGAIGSGWQLRQAEFDAFEVSDGGDGVIQYPVRFQSLIIDNEPDGSTGEGTIYLDELYVEEGPALYGYRFDRGQGQVDVLWAVGGDATIGLATTSPAAVVTDRDGQTQTIVAEGGTLPLSLGEAPLFVEHTAP